MWTTSSRSTTATVHLQGDLCLAEIGRCIKKAYARSGYCYRTGGDEFCVLMENADREAQCAQEFVLQLEQRRKAVDFLPTVSFGSAPFWGGCAGCEESGRPGDVPLQKGPEARCCRRNNRRRKGLTRTPPRRTLIGSTVCSHFNIITSYEKGLLHWDLPLCGSPFPCSGRARCGMA